MLSNSFKVSINCFQPSNSFKTTGLSQMKTIGVGLGGWNTLKAFMTVDSYAENQNPQQSVSVCIHKPTGYSKFILIQNLF